MPFSRLIKWMFKTIPCTDSEGASQFVFIPPEKYLLIPTCYFPLPNFKCLSTNQLLSPFQAQQQFLKTAIKSGSLCVFESIRNTYTLLMYALAPQNILVNVFACRYDICFPFKAFSSPRISFGNQVRYHRGASSLAGKRGGPAAP